MNQLPWRRRRGPDSQASWMLAIPCFDAIGIGVVAGAVTGAVEIETQGNETRTGGIFGEMAQSTVRADVLAAERRHDHDADAIGGRFVGSIQPAEARAVIGAEPAGFRDVAVASETYQVSLGSRRH